MTDTLRCANCDGDGRDRRLVGHNWNSEGVEVATMWPCSACRGTGHARCATCDECDATTEDRDGKPSCVECARTVVRAAETLPAPPPAMQDDWDAAFAAYERGWQWMGGSRSWRRHEDALVEATASIGVPLGDRAQSLMRQYRDLQRLSHEMEEDGELLSEAVDRARSRLAMAVYLDAIESGRRPTMTPSGTEGK